MNCQQVHESLGDHSVGMLEAETLSAFEQHVAICAECAKSLNEFTRCMELLDHMSSPTPPADLWMGLRPRLELERSVRQYATATPPQAPQAQAGSLWSGAIAAMAGFAAAAGVLVILATQPGGSTATVATVPPVAVSVSQHSIIDTGSPVADGASVVAADVVSVRPLPGQVRYPRVILPGRELLGEPITAGEMGAILSRPMAWPGTPAPEAGGDSRR